MTITRRTAFTGAAMVAASPLVSTALGADRFAARLASKCPASIATRLAISK